MHQIKFYTYGRHTVTDRWNISPNNIVNRLYYVHKAAAKYCFNGKKYTMKEGHLYVFPCTSSITFSNENGAPFDHTYFDFIINPPLTFEDVLEIDVSKHEHIYVALSAFDAYTKKFGRNFEKADDVVMRYFENLLFFIDKVRPLFTTADKRILSALEYIHKNYTSRIDVDTLAKIACMEKTYFIKIFAQNMKVTPYKYIKKCRIAHAISLIQQGVCVSEAAHLCGYESISSFSNMIKKSIGVYPSEI